MAFKERIDAWSEAPHLMSLVEAATELYNSVLSQDSVGYINANEKFQRVVGTLSAEGRKDLNRRQK